MIKKTPRLLEPNDVPATLWEAETKTLRLPQAVADAYVQSIKHHGLAELAATPAKEEGPTGGISKEETDKHFARRFDGAAARIQFALLDPESQLSLVPNTLLQSLAGNRLCLTDAPCGAGAATLGLLGCLAELRRTGVLPRQPLDIHLIGAELSEHARAYARELLDEVRPVLEEQAIFVEAEWLSWDVNDKVSTSDLVRQMTLISDKKYDKSYPNQLLLIANFSGFLMSGNNFNKAEGPFEEVLRYTSATGAIGVWLEPMTKKTTKEKGLFGLLNSKILEASQTFVKRLLDKSFVSGQTHVFRALAPQERVRVTLALNVFELGRFK